MRERSESTPAEDPQAGGRRRWREGWIILAAGLAAVSVIAVVTRPPEFGGSAGSWSDVTILALLNLSLILFVLLVFLVGRNLTKSSSSTAASASWAPPAHPARAGLRRDRAPADDAALRHAQTLMSNSIERWFDGEVERALEGSLDVANAYYEDLAADALGFGRKIASQLVTHDLLTPERRPRLKEFLAGRRDDYQIDLVEVFVDGQNLARARRPDLVGRLGVEPFDDIVQQAMAGNEGTVVHKDRRRRSSARRAGARRRVVKAVVVVDMLPKAPWRSASRSTNRSRS
jgi:two-component system nitrogen regulation sensor histidine kinase NtrY